MSSRNMQESIDGEYVDVEGCQKCKKSDVPLISYFDYGILSEHEWLCFSCYSKRCTDE